MKFIFMLLAGVGCFSAYSSHADIVIPAPGDIGSPLGSLLIDGEPGAGQSDQVEITVCPIDEKGNAIKFGCGRPLQTESYKLTQPKQTNPTIPLASGLAILRYSNHQHYIQIRPGHLTTIRLQKVLAPTNRIANLKIFVDLTNAAMQDERLYYPWMMDERPWIKLNCPNKSEKIQAVCNAFASDDRNSLRGVLYSFEKDGSYDFLDETQRILINRGRIIVNERIPKPGEFISALPGVYGVEFEDPVSKMKETQFGILVPE